MGKVRIVRQSLLNRELEWKNQKTVRGFMIQSLTWQMVSNQPELCCSITDLPRMELWAALLEEIYYLNKPGEKG